MTVSNIIFDLDNTLYPSTAKMDRGITTRMMSCVADYFHVSYDEAIRLRDENLPHYSTTLEWLRAEGLTDTETYFKRVHPDDEADELPVDENLRPLLQSIGANKIVLTNAPREHADRVLSKLGISDLFTAVCDIRSCALMGKPYRGAYIAALNAAGGTVENTVFLDDMQKYTAGYTALGGTAVLVGNKNGHAILPELLQAKYFCGCAVKEGRTLQIKSIYNLPNLLHQLCDL